MNSGTAKAEARDWLVGMLNETAAERGLRELRQMVDEYDRHKQQQYERHRAQRERAQRPYEETRAGYPERCRMPLAAGGSWLFDPPGRSQVF
jgi:hypothetical protein